MKITRLLFPILLVLALPLRAHEVAAEMARAAGTFLATLTPEQKAKAAFEFADAERKNWHFIPRERKGLPIKEMTEAQRKLAHALLQTGLSHRGYEKATGIMSLEAVLRELEKDTTGRRDPEKYFVSIFGAPGEKAAWGWRVEGHHLSLNFVNGGGNVLSITPSFFGTNPGEVRDGARKGTRILSAEEELGRELVKSLDDAQRKAATILPEAPKDILNVPGRSEWTKPEGLAQSKLTKEQSAALVKLIREYLDRHRPELAADDWAKIEKAGLDKIHFAWAGGLDRGQSHYYRVQGTSFVLEYDNTQNEANHVHSAWRDTGNDFGDDALARHYKDAHPAK